MRYYVFKDRNVVFCEEKQWNFSSFPPMFSLFFTSTRVNNTIKHVKVTIMCIITL